MFAAALTCVLAFAAQDGPGAVPPSFVIGLDTNQDATPPADDAGDTGNAKSKDAKSKDANSKDAKSKDANSNDDNAKTDATRKKPSTKANKTGADNPKSPYDDTTSAEPKVAPTNSAEPPVNLDPYAPWGAAVPADAKSDEGPYGERQPVPQTAPEAEKGYTPLPEGKVLPPNDPPPKPEPPPIDDADRPDPAGLSRPQFPPLLAVPLQVISGIIAGIGMVPVSALTLGLGICATPAAIALAEVGFADLVGQNRGTLFWPTLGAYGASATCTTLYASGAGLAIGLVLTGVITFAAISPALLISGVLIAPLALFPAFVAANIVATAIAPAVIYPFTSEPKNADDPELHFPGFFSPNHRTPRLPPGTPTAAMRY